MVFNAHTLEAPDIVKYDLVAIILFLALFVVVVLDLLIRSYPVWSIVWMYKGLTEGLLVHL